MGARQVYIFSVNGSQGYGLHKCSCPFLATVLDLACITTLVSEVFLIFKYPIAPSAMGFHQSPLETLTYLSPLLIECPGKIN